MSLKFIGELFNEDKIILGGKESAGLSVQGHYPQKDGILACLLAAEEMAAGGASLNKRLAALEQRVRAYCVGPDQRELNDSGLFAEKIDARAGTVSRTPRQACKPIGRSEIYLRGWVLAVIVLVWHRVARPRSN